MKEYNPNNAVEFIYKNGPALAKAKGQLAELEAWKHSLKALKMATSEQTTIAAKEMDAYRSEEYQSLCKAIGAATEQAESLKWQLTAAQMRFQAWQTESANNRFIEKATQ
jgi:hypothetical protein